MIQNIFFIVRHGESENNLLGIESTLLQNKDQFGLSENGKKQTEIEAKKFKDFDIIISSPFRRAKETAFIFAQHSKCKVIEDNLLCEVCVGNFELQKCKKIDSFSEKYGEEASFPNGESLLDVKNRAIKFFEQINQTYKNKKILIVTHGWLVLYLIEYTDKGFNREKYLKEYYGARKVREL